MAGFRPRSSRSTTQPTRDCVEGPAGAPWRTSFRRTLEHAAGPVRALCFVGPVLCGACALRSCFGAQGFWGRCIAALCFLPAAICTVLSAECHPGTAPSGTALPGALPSGTALPGRCQPPVPGDRPPRDRVIRDRPPQRSWPSPRASARRDVWPEPQYRPAGGRGLNFPASGIVGMEYEAVLVAAGSRPFACGVQGTPSPLPGVGWDEGPQAGELFTQVPHIARYIVRHAGYHAEGTGPGHPDIWVPPTAL